MTYNKICHFYWFCFLIFIGFVFQFLFGFIFQFLFGFIFQFLLILLEGLCIEAFKRKQRQRRLQE